MPQEKYMQVGENNTTLKTIQDWNDFFFQKYIRNIIFFFYYVTVQK